MPENGADFLAIEDGDVDDPDAEDPEEETAVDDGFVEPEDSPMAVAEDEMAVDGGLEETAEAGPIAEAVATADEEEFTGTEAPLTEDFAGTEAPKPELEPAKAFGRSSAFCCTPKKINFDAYSESPPLSNEQQRQLAIIQIRSETSQYQ